MSIQQETIQVTSAAGTFSAYLAAPEHPNGVAVVVLQEIFGVNPNVREIVDEFAESGYAVIAPDLFWRQEARIELDPSSEDDVAKAKSLMAGLDRGESFTDSVAALAALRHRIAGLERSAAVGYCYGGGVAYLMATRGVVDLGVAYYGTGLHTMLEEAPASKGRLLLHIAGDDYLCPPEAQEQIDNAMKALGDRGQAVVYPGAGHAFARRGGAAFDEAAAMKANGLTMAALADLKEA